MHLAFKLDMAFKVTLQCSVSCFHKLAVHITLSVLLQPELDEVPFKVEKWINQLTGQQRKLCPTTLCLIVVCKAMCLLPLPVSVCITSPVAWKLGR